jgi:hypothetical protein
MSSAIFIAGVKYKFQNNKFQILSGPFGKMEFGIYPGIGGILYGGFYFLIGDFSATTLPL